MDDPVNGPRPYDVRIIEDRWATFRHIIEGIAIISAGLWAIYTFIYVEKIKPQFETATAEFSVVFDRGHARGPIDESTFIVTVTNTGHADIDIVAEAFSIVGEKLGTTPQKKSRMLTYFVEDDRTLPAAASSLVYASGYLRDGARHGHAGNHVVLRPGEHFDYRIPVSWPRGRFDDLNFQYQFIYDRFPIRSKLDVTLVRRKDGTIDLRGGPNILRNDVGATYFL